MYREIEEVIFIKLIVCLDDKGGMAFNRRRQSRDRLLCEDVARMVGDDTLWVHPYSEPLFAELGIHISMSESYLSDAEERDYCFCERESLGDFAKKGDAVIIYRWNRRYPGDVFFDIDVTAAPWRCVLTEKFVGSSHEEITKEVYFK